MKSILIRNAKVVNEGRTLQQDVLIEGAFIKEINDEIVDFP